jgi:hypothetical protein
MSGRYTSILAFSDSGNERLLPLIKLFDPFERLFRRDFHALRSAGLLQLGRSGFLGHGFALLGRLQLFYHKLLRAAMSQPARSRGTARRTRTAARSSASIMRRNIGSDSLRCSDVIAS